MNWRKNTIIIKPTRNLPIWVLHLSPPQSASSEPSLQSFWPSHTHDFKIHWLSLVRLQRNSKDEQDELLLKPSADDVVSFIVIESMKSREKILEIIRASSLVLIIFFLACCAISNDDNDNDDCSRVLLLPIDLASTWPPPPVDKNNNINGWKDVIFIPIQIVSI